MIILQIVPRPIVLPGPLDTLLPLADQFGENLRQIFNPQGVARDKFRQGLIDGTIDAADLARQARANDGDVSDIATLFGFKLDDEKSMALLEGAIAGHPETFEQRLEAGRLKEGVPEAQAGAEAAGFGAAEAEAGVSAVVAEETLGAGLPALEAAHRVTQINAEATGLKFTSDMIKKHTEYVKALPKVLQDRAIAAVANPEFLRDLQFLERMDLERSKLAAAQAKTDAAREAARFDTYIKLQDQIVPLAKQLIDADENGRDEEIKLLKPIMENLLLQHREMFPEFRSSIVQLEEGLLGGISVKAFPVESLDDQNFLQDIQILAMELGTGWEAEFKKPESEGGNPAALARLEELGLLGEMRKRVVQGLKGPKPPITREAVVVGAAVAAGVPGGPINAAINTTIDALTMMKIRFGDEFVDFANWVAAGGIE